MAVNASELISSPWETVLSPFTDLLGSGFYLFPVTFIAIALYVKTHDVVLASSWLVAAGILLSAGSIFTGYLEVSVIYIIITAMGVTGVVMGILFMKK